MGQQSTPMILTSIHLVIIVTTDNIIYTYQLSKIGKQISVVENNIFKLKQNN